jgi:hypothetical protein
MKIFQSPFHYSLFTIHYSILIVLSSYSLTVQSQQEWELIHNPEPLVEFDHISMTDTAHIWGVGSGKICFSGDGGYHWNVQFDEYD